MPLPEWRTCGAGRAGLYASSMPAEQLARNDVDPASLTDIIAAVGEGWVDRAFELTSPELADRLT